MESGTGAGERPHQQRDPLGGGEAPDVDQHDGVAVGAQEAFEVGVAVGDRAGNCGLVPALGILDEPAPEVSSALQSVHRSGTEPDHVDAVGNIRYPLGIDPQQLDRGCSVGG